MPLHPLSPESSRAIMYSLNFCILYKQNTTSINYSQTIHRWTVHIEPFQETTLLDYLESFNVSVVIILIFFLSSLLSFYAI